MCVRKAIFPGINKQMGAYLRPFFLPFHQLSALQWCLLWRALDICEHWGKVGAQPLILYEVPFKRVL